MADILGREVYINAEIDIENMTITEIDKDEYKTYSITELLERWNGIPHVNLVIESIKAVPMSEGGVFV